MTGPRRVGHLAMAENTVCQDPISHALLNIGVAWLMQGTAGAF